MKKRVLSVILAVILAFSAIMPAFAAGKSDALRFDENGEFRILHLCDFQDDYPSKKKR